MLKVKMTEEITFLINGTTEDVCNFIDNSSIADIRKLCKEKRVMCEESGTYEILKSVRGDDACISADNNQRRV